MERSILFQWILAIFSLLSGVIIFGVFHKIGIGETFPQGVGKIDAFIHNSTGKDSEYIGNITAAFGNASSVVRIISKNFIPPEEDHPILKAMENAAARGVKILMMTTNKTKIDAPFFMKIKNSTQIRILQGNSESFSHIISYVIIADESEYLQLSNFLNLTQDESTRLIGLRIRDRKIIKDAISIFEMSWRLMKPEDERTLPPYSRFWPQDLLPLTAEDNPSFMADNSSIFLSVPPNKRIINTRINTYKSVQSILTKMNSGYDVTISSDFFEIPSNFEFQNFLVSTVFNKGNVRILISRNHDFNKSIKSAGMLVPYRGIQIRVGPENKEFANYMTVNKTLFFVSDSVTGRAYQNTLGIGIVSKDSPVVDKIIGLFEDDWKDNTTSFKDHMYYVYGE